MKTKITKAALLALYKVQRAANRVGADAQHAWHLAENAASEAQSDLAGLFLVLNGTDTESSRRGIDKRYKRAVARSHKLSGIAYNALVAYMASGIPERKAMDAYRVAYEAYGAE
jgi:hypothetical protein